LCALSHISMSSRNIVKSTTEAVDREFFAVAALRKLWETGRSETHHI